MTEIVQQKQELEVGYGLGWFMGRWRKTFADIDKEEIRDEVRRLTEKYPKDSNKQLAERAVKKMSKHTGFIGVAAATPALVPGIGTAVSILSVVPEEIYLIRKQCEMTLVIAALFGRDPGDPERLYEIITLAGTPSQRIEALMVAKADLRRVAAKMAVQISARSVEKKALVGFKAVSRGVLRRLPALGFFAGGLINYLSFKSLGKKAVRFYGKSREDEVTKRPDRILAGKTKQPSESQAPSPS